MEGEENQGDFQKKQNLLQKEIIDKNYDKTAFINFCMSKKDNGDDLNNWTYDELSGIVQEFISTQKDNEPEQHEIVQKGGEEEIKTENIEKIEQFNAEEHKNFTENKIACKKLEKTQLNDKEVKVTVAKPVTVEGGMFGKSYIKYEVTTQPFGWTVERRYSDFDALRKLIQKYYPSFYVPPLPQKKLEIKDLLSLLFKKE
jgi:sorting nexin-7/30/sorting nexin-8